MLRKMLRTILAVALLFAPMSVSFGQEKPAQPVLKIAVMADGRIAVNGAPATIQSLRESLKKLSQQRGVVWYYREAANTVTGRILYLSPFEPNFRQCSQIPLGFRAGQVRVTD